MLLPVGPLVVLAEEVDEAAAAAARHLRVGPLAVGAGAGAVAGGGLMYSWAFGFCQLVYLLMIRIDTKF